MLRHILAFLGRFKSRLAPFDPSVFNDPVADITSWEPHWQLGSEFDNRIMVPLGKDAVEFSATIMAYLVPGLFLMLGGIPLCRITYTILNSGFDLSHAIFIPFNLLFFFPGFYGVIRAWKSKVVFDKNTGMVYNQSANSRLNPFKVSISEVPLDEVHAVQVLAKTATTSDNSVGSLELNIVMKDGSRMNVMDHSEGGKLMKEALQLSHFLGVKYWNTVSK